MILNRIVAAYVAVKLVAFGAFALSVADITAAHAEVSFGGGAVSKDEASDPTVCTGENLVLSIGRTQPDAMARIDAVADATVYGSGRAFRLEKAGVAPSFMYGTMHVSDERATALSDTVRAAIAGADVVALELKEIADPALMQAKMGGLVSQSLYLDGTTLGSRLDPKARETVEQALATRGPVPWMAAQRMRPWLLMAAMSVPACETARRKDLPIVDQLIAQIAAENGKPLVGLETIEGQVGILAGLPEPLMIRALTDVARLGARMDDVFETSVALYESGEIAKIWALMRDPAVAAMVPDDEDGAAERRAGYAAFQREVIDRRNRDMVETLEPLLEAGNAFAAVGALHLPGEGGMLRLLEAKGWTVVPLD